MEEEKQDLYKKEIDRLEEELAELKKLPLLPGVHLEGFIKKLSDRIKDLADRKHRAAWRAVKNSRHPKRPQMLDYLNLIFDRFYELDGDRRTGDDKAIVCGLAAIEGETCIVIGHQKGHDTNERIYRNFGMASPSGYHKAIRMMQLAEKFGFPVITFVDTPGAFPAIEAEERNQGYAISSCILKMLSIRVPTVAFIIGEGGSGGALALASADRVYILKNATYSVISPEGCASILWKDAKMAPLAANALKLTSRDLLSLGIVDDVILEPMGGAQRNLAKVAMDMRNRVSSVIREYRSSGKDFDTGKRRNRYLSYGRDRIMGEN
ncbi:MAG: acetyl-CoA carboxylase carboxyltransferase subunit alpha [Omnitrophica WOR_2 bacterium RBG_13_44_8]|nr:MAG: acetyl-CoA carboxylase carboxyltransferase subunit alpha [Omnitrophica WOR_2 bacterium RBG_13_44_8]